MAEKRGRLRGKCVARCGLQNDEKDTFKNSKITKTNTHYKNGEKKKQMTN